MRAFPIRYFSSLVLFVSINVTAIAQDSNNETKKDDNENKTLVLTIQYIESLYPNIAEEAIYYARKGNLVQAELNTANHKLTGIQNQLIALNKISYNELQPEKESETQNGKESLKDQKIRLLKEQDHLKSSVSALETKIYYLNQYNIIKDKEKLKK